MFPLRRIEYPYDISTVFPHHVDPASRIPMSRTSTQSLPQVNDETSAKLEYLLVVDYRYARFALDPRTGLFSMVKCAVLILPSLNILTTV